MNRSELKKNTIVFLIYWLFFLYFQSTSLYGGDAGDLVSAAYTGSIAHPPGYPLYSFIGWITSHIPLSTVAWRVGLISSLASAGTLTILYVLLKRLTHSHIASACATATLACTYVFWLYALVPEVFGLLSFFIALLLYLGYDYSRKPRNSTLYLIALTAGLALTHHHIVIFVFPSVAMLVLHQRTKLMSLTKRELLIIPLCGILGLTPYLWAVIAGLRVTPITWDDPVTLSNLYRLISRADYGSFQSGIVYGEHIQSRLLQFVALFDYYIQDFTIFGVIIGGIGLISMYKHHRHACVAFFTGWLLTGPGYFFYASYLYSTRFHIATAERFVLPSYIFVTIFIGYGISYIYTAITRLPESIHHLRPLLLTGAYLLICIIPLSLFLINYPRISILKHDRTAEKFAYDILRDLEPNSILLLQGDHPVFNTQYVYYTQGYRNDVQLVHLSKLLNGTGIKQLKKQYPKLRISTTGDRVVNFVKDLSPNYDSYPIYANIPLDLIPEGYRWVPYGHVFRLYRTADIPSYQVVRARSDFIWSRFQHPLEGSLGKYPNLMLSNIADYYRDAQVRRGLYASNAGKDYELAYDSYIYALRLDPESGAIRYLLGETELARGRCTQAKKFFDDGYSHRTDDRMLYIDSLISLYTECDKNPAQVKKWEKQKIDFSKSKEQPLQGL